MGNRADDVITLAGSRAKRSFSARLRLAATTGSMLCWRKMQDIAETRKAALAGRLGDLPDVVWADDIK